MAITNVCHYANCVTDYLNYIHRLSFHFCKQRNKVSWQIYNYFLCLTIYSVTLQALNLSTRVFEIVNVTLCSV